MKNIDNFLLIHPKTDYENELWGGIDLLQKREVSFFRIVNGLISTYNEIEFLERYYSNGLKQIEKFMYIPEPNKNYENETLNLALMSLKNFCDECSKIHEEFANSINKLVLEYQTLLQKNRKEVPNFVLNYHNKNNKYNNDCLKLEQYKKEYYEESEKAVQRYQEYLIVEKKQSKKSKNDSMKKKYNEQFLKAHEKEQAYLDYINEMNIKRENFIEDMKQAYKLFENFDGEYINQIKEIGQKLIKCQFDTLNNMIIETKKYENILDKINFSQDLIIFSVTRRTHKRYPPKITFNPFNSSKAASLMIENVQTSIEKNFKNSKTEISKSIKDLLPKYIQETFSYKEPELQPKNFENESYANIEMILHKIREGFIDEETKKQMKKYLEVDKKKLYFLEGLNKIRGKYPCLNKQSFSALVELFKFAIKLSYQKKDYDSLRYILILAQTFYTTTEKDAKYLLLENLKSMEIWKDEQLWQELIKSEIIYNIDQKKGKVIIKDEFDSQAMNLIYNTLLTYKFVMQIVQLDRNTISTILIDYANEYGLSSECKESLKFPLKHNQEIDDIPNESLLLPIGECNGLSLLNSTFLIDKSYKYDNNEF